MDYLSLAQRSYQLIKSKLLSDEIRPGERLWEDQLAEEISMSRTPVREAVNQLIAERLVRRVPRKGIFAVDYTASEMLDIVATRTIIETQAARLCCQNISEEQMTRMDAVLQQYVDMLRSTGQKKANVYDAELHRMLGECSGSALIRRYVEDLENMVVFVRKKDEYDDLGLLFDTYLMDKQRSCRNQCVFCFIDQMPPGMRQTLYFKDDDARMSFLYGNYITLTNLSEHDIERTIKMKISPINVSVHTTNPELRCKMMHNRFAGDALKTLWRFAEAGISLNTQLVLCPGLNDGPELIRSLNDLKTLGDSLLTVSCVPVGLTKFRDGLFPLRPYTKEEAGATIDLIDRFGDEQFKSTGNRLFYAADEFYIKAERSIPNAEFYGDFNQ